MNRQQYDQVRCSKRRCEPRPPTAAVPATPATGATYECPDCRRRYIRPFPAQFCWECVERRRAAEERLRVLRAQSGISPRHGKFRSWAELLQHSPGETYARAAEATQRFLAEGDGVLALIGNRGAGKTQIGAVAICSAIEDGRGARIVHVLDLLRSLKARFGGDTGDAEGAWLDEWARPYLLAIDEIAELVSGEHGRAWFARLIDRRYERQTPTILLGNLTVAAFPECVGASVASRTCEGGGVLVCDWPTFRH